MSRWMPISTAPKDGSYVLLANESGVWVGHYINRFMSGFRPKNPWLSMLLNHRHMPGDASRAPTHWMPLPEPPKGETA